MINELYDEDLTYIMDYEILYAENSKYENDNIFNFEDKELLIKYAPKLFNTCNDLETAKDLMINFVEKVYQYKRLLNPYFISNALNSEMSTKYEKDYKGKVNSLQTHISEALDLMSRKLDAIGGTVGTKIQDIHNEKLPLELTDNHRETIGDLVVDILYQIKENPEKYLMKKDKLPLTQTKNEIKKYLISLKLKNKSNEISNFMKELN